MVTRANTWQDAYNTGNAVLDLGDGILIPLPIDGSFPGTPGPPGPGVPEGGSAFQIIRKNSTGTTTEWVSLTKSIVGLSNVDNTADADKPLSDAATVALAAKVGTDVFKVTPGDTPLTDGDIVILGKHGYVTRTDVNMGIVAGGGVNNENVIGGNTANVNTGTSNLQDAPVLTGTDGNWDFILAGYDNVVNGWAAVVAGFHCKVATGANHVTISGGSIHSVEADVNYPTIGGGTGSTIKTGGSGGTISGGLSHELSGSSATIGGGTTNKATGFHSTVAGGGNNTASGGSSSTVGGGESNTASGAGATVPGGNGNTASGYHSTAAGRGAIAASGGMRSYGAQFTAAGDAQDSVVNMKQETVDATAGGLSCDGASGLVIPENTTWAISILLVGRRADVDGENAAWKIDVVLKRDTGNTAALVGSPTITQIGANAGNTWAVAVTAATAGNLNINVTGEAGKTVRWLANLRIAHVSG